MPRKAWRVAAATVVATWTMALAMPSALADSSRNATPMECAKRHSRAWCVLDAAGMSHKLDDLSRKQVDEVLKDSGLGVVDIAFMAGAAGGLLPAPSLGTKWTDVSMVLLSALAEKRPAVPGYNKVIGWMPIEMAATADDADELLNDMLHRATRDALSGYAFQPATFPANPWRPRTLQFDDQSGWLLSGPGCAPGQCRLWNRRDRNSFPEPPREGRAPEWLGGYKAWVFEFKSGPSMHELWTGGAYESVRYASALSRLMPDWAYLVLTPEQPIPGASSAKPVLLNPGLRMPLVMNRGQTWLPVFPEIEAKPEGASK